VSRHAAGNLTRRRDAGRRPGYTLVELLIGMAMLAMIMVAVALAMQGAANANIYAMDKSRSLQQASLTLNRLSTDIRRAQSIQIVEPGCLDLVMPDNQWRRYQWGNAEGDPLMFSSDLNPDGNMLVADVTTFKLIISEGFSEVQQAVVPLAVQIILEVREGTASTRLDTTVKPRRNIL
jgi:prepilin-type N-terminal cleavage/methylation domain-containing protein